MPTVDLSLHGLLEGNFFNFLIILGLLVLALIKLKPSDALENAANTVAELLKKSDEEKAGAQKTLEEVKTEAQKLPEELAQIKKDAQNTIDSFKKATEVEIEQTTQRLENNAQRAIETEVQKITSVLQRETSLQAVKVAQERTVNRLAENNDLHRKFIEEAINKIEELEI